MNIEFHEAANIFPMMEGEDFRGLVEDIRKNGLQLDVELLEGKIIDGRNRYKACKEAGVNPRMTVVKADDPVAYVLSRNLHRRHLSISQRAMVAARVREVYEKAAKERQRTHGGTAPGRPKTLVADLPQVNTSRKARDEAGKSLNVGGRTVDYATAVIEKGVPELVKAVDQGKITVSTASSIVKEAPEVQRKFASGELTGKPPKREPEPPPASSNGTPRTTTSEPIKPKGRGILLAHEAINILQKIPRNDSLRERGFQMVAKWIRDNK